jgi:4-hydroxy-tetrahydrodipicolinate synthase
MKKVGRLITAMATPFDEKGEVNYAQAKKFATALLNSGSDGILVGGTTGESPTLSHEEKLRLFKDIKAVVGERGAVIAGTGNYNTAESVELTREAEKIGVYLADSYGKKHTEGNQTQCRHQQGKHQRRY